VQAGDIRKAKRMAFAEGFQLSRPQFELLDEILRVVRDKDSFFGGMQVILEGDYLQYVFSSSAAVRTAHRTPTI
jgi:hypothetical protein